ncbi:MAG: hypothetical protein ABI212_11690 [Burkholderiaceae bacterium]
MSFLSVLFGRSKPSNARTAAADPERIGQPRDAAGGAVTAKSASSLPLAPRSDGKTGVDAERADRRERLYRVVREALMRCGVLSASYKFKVLSTDARGLQFLVMLDVASDTAQLMRFSEIEAIIRQTAKDQYDVDVVAVYSRVNPQLAARATQMPTAGYGEPAHSQRPFAMAPGPASTQAGHSAANHHAEALGLGQAALPAGSSVFGLGKSAAPDSRFDPIHADEVNAFKRALSGNNSQPAPADGVVRRSGARRKPIIDFEDTQVVAARGGRPDLGLSATQYGDLQ